MKRILLTLAILLVPVLALAQPKQKEIVKTGWNIGLLPAFRYDNDLGFQLGALSQLYHYGDGSDYPNYRHKVMAVASVYSRGAKQFSLDYDSKHLLRNMRVTAHAEYMDNPLHGFYGFNGAVAPYYADLDRRKAADGQDGIAFYANAQHQLTASLDLQGRMADHLTWIGGVRYAWQDYKEGLQGRFRKRVRRDAVAVPPICGERADFGVGDLGPPGRTQGWRGL